MPLDGNVDLYTTPDLTTPSWQALAWVLEHPDLWPPRWHWDFRRTASRTECGTAGCAAGIAITLWGRAAYQPFGIDPFNIGHAIFLRTRDPVSRAIFIDGADHSEAYAITPAVVAKRIRQYLAGKEITFTGDDDAA